MLARSHRGRVSTIRVPLREGVALRRQLTTSAGWSLSSRAVHRRLLEKERVCNLKSIWECRQPVHQRNSLLAVCPQHCPVPSPEGVRLHTHAPTRCPHRGTSSLFFKRSAERSGRVVQEPHQPRCARRNMHMWREGDSAETWPEKDRANTELRTGGTGPGTTRR